MASCGVEAALAALKEEPASKRFKVADSSDEAAGPASAVDEEAELQKVMTEAMHFEVDLKQRAMQNSERVAAIEGDSGERTAIAGMESKVLGT